MRKLKIVHSRQIRIWQSALLLLSKGRTADTGRGTFICLHRRPEQPFRGGRDSERYPARLENVRRFEEPPIGGNPIKVGDELIGSALNSLSKRCLGCLAHSGI